MKRTPHHLASLPAMWKDIRTVASALGAPERGDQLVTCLVDRLQAVQARTALGRTRPSIACIEWIDPVMGAGNWVHELVDRAARMSSGRPGSIPAVSPSSRLPPPTPT